MKARKILITGGSGFIGGHLVQSLVESGAEVINLDRNPPPRADQKIHWKPLDLLDRPALIETFQLWQPAWVVHLAARTDLDESASLEEYIDNIAGVENLLAAVSLTKSVERLLMTSSMLVCRLGYTPKSSEDYAPSTIYGESKVLTEKITRENNPDCIWSIVRPATIWGPYHFGLKAGFFSILQRGMYFHPGGKPCRKSYGYVGNSVDQLVALLLAPAEAVNRKVFYLSDKPMDLENWVAELSVKLTGKKLRVIPYPLLKAGALVGDMFIKLGVKRFPISSFRLGNMTTENIVDTDGIFSVSGEPRHSLSDGIDETVKWLKS